MVSIPSGVNVPGADKAVIDIAAKLKAMPDINCGYFVMPVYIVAIAKPKNTLLPLYVPVSGATIEGRVLSAGYIEVKRLTTFADLNGITYACVPILPTVWYEFRAKQYNVDFGNGLSQFSNWKSVKDVVVFEGTIDIPCTSGTFPINADFLNLIPRVWSDPISINVPGYKTITPTGMPFTIYINNVEIGSGTLTSAPLSFTAPKKLTDITALLASMGKSVEVKAVIKFGTCEWVGRKTIALPAPEELLCKVWETVAKVTVPPVLQPLSAIFVSGANYVCKDFDKTELVNATALVRIGSRVFNIEIRNGTGFLTLTKSDIAKLVG